MSMEFSLLNPPPPASDGAEQTTQWLELLRETLILYFAKLAEPGCGISLDDDNKLQVKIDGSKLSCSDSGVTVVESALAHASLSGLTGDAHSDMVFDAPATTDRNVIQPGAAAAVALVLKNHASQSTNLTEWQASDGGVMASVSQAGYLTIRGLSADNNQIVSVAEASSGQAHAVPRTQLESTASGKGASMIGIQDAGTYTSNTTVEAALQELYGKLGGVAWSLWVPLHGTQVQDGGTGTLSNSGVGIVSSSDYDGHSVAANWGATNKEGFAFSWTVPGDLKTSAVVTAKLYYRLSGNPGSRHASYCGIDARAVADNEVTISGGSLASVAAVKELDDGGYSSGDLVVHSVGTLFAASTLAAGDYVKGVAYRDPTNADDDYTGTCQFVGVLFEGTRSL